MNKRTVQKYIENSGLIIANENDIVKLSKIAGEAYEDYPLHKWFCNGVYNKRISEIIMQTSIKTMLKEGIIYYDETESGFAIWLPEGFNGSKALPFILSGGYKLIFLGGFKLINRLSKYENFAMKLKKEITNHNDWYLYNLSVLPSEQGKGIGSKLLKPMIELCEKNNKLCYLETNKINNVSLYKHFGFELIYEKDLLDSDIKHYCMLKKNIEEV